MEKCLLCLLEFKNKRSLSGHLFKAHRIKAEDYKISFDLHRKCIDCGKIVSKNSSNRCSKCKSIGKNNAFFGKTHTKECIEKFSAEITKSLRRKWEDPEYRARVKKGTTGKKRSEEFKENQRTAALKQFKDPKQRELRSLRMEKTWQENKIGYSNRNNVNRSKQEKHLVNRLRDFGFDISEKETIRNNKKWYYPDIVIGKIIIEFFGDYWHANPKKYSKDYLIRKEKAENIWIKDSERIKIFEKLGYVVFVVWQSELKEEEEKCLNELKYKIEKATQNNKEEDNI